MALVSIRSSTSRSSRYSSACMEWGSTREQASVWLSAGRSSSGTGAEYGLNPSPAKAQDSDLRCPRARSRHRSKRPRPRGGNHDEENDMWDVRSAEILLVEDNPADVGLTREALYDARVANRLT